MNQSGDAMKLVNVVTGADYALDLGRNHPTRLPTKGIICHVNLEVNGRTISCPVNDNVAWAAGARPLYYVWMLHEGRSRYVTLEQPDELDSGKFRVEVGTAKRVNPPRLCGDPEREAERIRRFQATMAKRKRKR